MMPIDTRKTVEDMTELDDLTPLSKRLNAATDELNKVLETIQTKLNALAIGVEVWLGSSPRHVLDSRIVDAKGNRRTIREAQLGYARQGEGWALVVRYASYDMTREANREEWEYVDGNPYAIEVKPLLRAAREHRVRAVDVLPYLIDALKAEAEKVIGSVEKAKKVAEALK
jgi:hypothetical protein